MSCKSAIARFVSAKAAVLGAANGMKSSERNISYYVKVMLPSMYG